MEIKAYKVPIRKIVEGYVNNSEDGVMGLGGKLNIRPAYQREFVYKDKQRDEVINTVRKKFPLNIMYWVESTNGYEVLDGQQRTISICEYVKGSYSIDYKYFHNLTEYEQDQILDYELNNKVRGKEICISKEDSKVQAWIVPTNEELVIARDTYRILGF